MIIYYPTGYGSNQGCVALQHQRQGFVCYDHSTQMFDALAQYHHKDPDTRVLLHEKHFHIHSFHLFEHFSTPCTIGKITDILQQKFIDIQEKHREKSAGMQILIDNIYIDGKQKKRLLRQEGDIFFSVSFLFFDHGILSHIEKIGEQYPQAVFFPKSFCTVQHIKTQLSKSSFYLLYINDSASKLVHVHQGCYQDVQDINMGSGMLYDMYKENDLTDLFFASKETIEARPMVKMIMYQCVEFFTQMLAKRLRSHITQQSDIILISPLTKNIIFQEQFNKWYNHFINGYILPFSISDSLDTYNKKRKKEEIDVLTYLNWQEEIEKMKYQLAL